MWAGALDLDRAGDIDRDHHLSQAGGYRMG